MKTVYLAGLISTEHPESLAWRDVARRKLWDYAGDLGKDVVVLSPLRGKADLEGATSDGGITHPATTAKDVMYRDRADILRADIILVNLNDWGSERPMVGTMFELAWAWDHKKPVVAVVDDNNYLMKSHPFVVEAVTHYFEDLDSACKFVARYFV